MFVIVCYDIVDNKKRNRSATILKDYGTRVQFSVFECILEKERLEKLKERCLSVIDKEEDSVRIYRQCESCRKEIKILGAGTVTEDEELLIV